jgi:hypothetical protein
VIARGLVWPLVATARFWTLINNYDLSLTTRQASFSYLLTALLEASKGARRYSLGVPMVPAAAAAAVPRALAVGAVRSRTMP